MKLIIKCIIILLCLQEMSCKNKKIIAVAKATYERVDPENQVGFSHFKIGLQNGVFVLIYYGLEKQDSVLEFIGIDANRNQSIIQWTSDSNYYPLDCTYTSNEILSTSRGDTVINNHKYIIKTIVFKNDKIEQLYIPGNYRLNLDKFDSYKCCSQLQIIKQSLQFPELIIYKNHKGIGSSWRLKELLIDSITTDISKFFE
jgi:hypothetical protein